MACITKLVGAALKTEAGELRKGRAARRVTYRVQVRLKGHAPQTATFKTRKEAETWATTTEGAIREGRHFPAQEGKRRTVADLIKRRLQTVERENPGALVKARWQLGWWKEHLGHTALASVTPAVLAKARDQLGSENIGTEEAPKYRGPATINRILAAFSKALTDAVREYHWLHDNPMRRVTKRTEPPGRVRYLSEEERKRLLDACAQSDMKELSLIVMLALSTGMRRGEVMGLRWPDVDLKRRLIVLHKTKNKTRRGVPILPRVGELLAEHAKVRRLDTDLLFSAMGKGGKRVPVDPSKPFKEALREAKIENFRFHDLRHTAASYLAMSGATTAEIAAVLGHKTLAMVQRYSHLSQEHVGTVVERMAAKFLDGAA
jgi:integrase